MKSGGCTIIAGFKAGVVWSPPRPATDPAWYDSKASFYCFNFMIEILILALYVGSRVDKRFYVPDGSSKRRTYGIEEDSESDGEVDRAEGDLEKKRDSGADDGRV